MDNIVGVAIFGLGLVLLIFGFNEAHSASSDISRFFTGNPTDHSMWLIVGGVGAIVAGLLASISGGRKT